MTRRNPLVILLCLELMLNAANLALIAFSRMHGNGDGQIFAIIVMVVAACEVTVGLGVIVAMHRRGLPDRRRRAAGAAGLMQTTAWLVLALPLAGSLVTALGYSALARARRRASSGRLAIAGAFVCTVLTLIKLQDLGEEERQVLYVGWDYAKTVGVDAKVSILVDPLSVFMVLVVTGVSTLIHLYSIAYMGSDRGYTRFFAYLNFFVFSMLVLVLAGNFFLLIVGWAFVGAASYLLISFWYRRETATRGGHQGVRHQRRRRRRPRARHVLHLQAARARWTSSARSSRPARCHRAAT